jgi:polyhydroxyalkanoate synthesis repressor PhaR
MTMPLIKRYSNRKLYDVDASAYVTLDDVAEMVRRGDEIKVVDYASGADLTALTLTQVIFDQEKKLGGLLPQAILTRLLRVGNSTLQTIRDGMMAFLDPIQYVEDEIRRRLALLVEEGSITTDEGQRLGDLLVAARMRPAPLPPVEPAQPQEVAALRGQVEQLEQELEKLQAAQKQS